MSLLQPSISSDGTWLVYQTYTPSSFGVRGGRDVWLENTVTQTTLRISQTADGRPASDLNLTSDPEPGSVISADGSTVAFYSAAPLLGTNQPGIYEYDVRTGTLGTPSTRC